MKKILIANRGEIALRIIHAAKELGLKTVVVYADGDQNSLPVKMADEAYALEGADAAQTYLNIPKLMALIKKSGADSVHPGYGFLSENAAFAKAVEKSGCKFVGPTSQVIASMGNKLQARQLAEKCGVPVVPGWEEKPTGAKFQQWVKKVGLPILIKAVSGGGGRGMRMVHDEKNLAEELASASREAGAAFGDASLYIEKLLLTPRHIEVQILADEHGHIVHLGERECSLQRRHQKVIEECPSPSISNDLRKKLFAASLALAKAVHYTSAGTMEFMVDAQDNFYFLEMNTRLQVEHPVTEAVTGVDLVKAQILIADGHRLPFKQEDIQFRGHAIEARVYAEDPEQDFMPSIGKIGLLQEPKVPGLRVDSFLEVGLELSPYFDPMLSKVVAYGINRKEALGKLDYALSNYVILGVKHNLNFLIDLLQYKPVQKGHYHNQSVHEFLKNRAGSDVVVPEAVMQLIQKRPTKSSAMPSNVMGIADSWLSALKDFRNV